MGRLRLRLDETCLRVAFTNVPYYADGGFHIDNTGVYFDDISLRDSYDGTGTLSGSVNWDRFQNMAFDTRLRVNSIEALNIRMTAVENAPGSAVALERRVEALEGRIAYGDQDMEPDVSELENGTIYLVYE